MIQKDGSAYWINFLINVKVFSRIHHSPNLRGKTSNRKENHSPNITFSFRNSFQVKLKRPLWLIPVPLFSEIFLPQPVKLLDELESLSARCVLFQIRITISTFRFSSLFPLDFVAYLGGLAVVEFWYNSGYELEGELVSEPWTKV